MSAHAISPFLKWAGGKRWLVDRHAELLSLKYDRFIEPFLGSGAVFFALQPSDALLCDKNERLIEAYTALRDDWVCVKELLNIHHKKHTTDYYYSLREKKLRSSVARAAQFIYLNRTCWNGLYRVNRKGEFNVPIGTKQNVILSTDDFEATSQALKNADIRSGDFEIALTEARKGDFVFVDPPYTVKHNHNGFVKYNESIFSWADQVRLRDCVEAAVMRGAKVLVTNAKHSSIANLYRGFGEQMTLRLR